MFTFLLLGFKINNIIFCLFIATPIAHFLKTENIVFFSIFYFVNSIAMKMSQCGVNIANFNPKMLKTQTAYRKTQ